MLLISSNLIFINFLFCFFFVKSEEMLSMDLRHALRQQAMNNLQAKKKFVSIFFIENCQMIMQFTSISFSLSLFKTGINF